MNAPILQIHGLRKHFGGNEVLKSIDLSIAPVSYTHLTLPTIYSV